MPRRKNTRPTSIYWLYDMRPEKLAARGPMGEPFYCGKTVYDPEKRLQQHRRTAVNKPHGDVAARVIECGKLIRVQTMEIVLVEEDWRPRERYWIYTMRLLWPGCCLNVTDGGEGTAGWIPTAESRAKVGATHRGVKKSPEHRAKIGNVHRGKKVSPETRAKLSLASRGKTHSPEHRAKIGIAGKGRKFTAEHRAKISAALQGRKLSPEHTEKMAATKRGRKQSPESIAKRVAANTGRKHSVESRMKMSVARRKMLGHFPL